MEAATLDLSFSTDWAQVLRESRLRVTRQRMAALAAIQRNPHCDVQEIWDDIHEDMPTLSVQAIHVIVRDLVVSGVVRRVHLPGMPSVRYETRTGDNHHHVQCVICGQVEDVDCAVGEAPCLQPSQSHGMKIIYAEVVFGGLCPDCERKQDDERV